MKKTIISLLVLLLFVIATCTYKKTYTIYSLQDIEVKSPKIFSPITTKEAVKVAEIEAKIIATEKPKEIKEAKKIIEVEITKVIKEEKIIIPKVETANLKKEVISKTKKIISYDVEILKEVKVLDFLLQALIDRDIALENREKLLLDIKKLLQEALENRVEAIAKRTNYEVNRDNIHIDILKLRDTLLKKVYDEAEETHKNTYKVGE